MKNQRSPKRHPVPEKYHQLLYINQTDRRGNLIDFKSPPVVVYSQIPISEYKEKVLKEHIDAESLPMIYTDAKPFLILRPTALPYVSFIREELIESGLSIYEEFKQDNFIHFSDILYKLDPNTSFNWQWRIITRSLHDTGVQDQNTAFVFLFNNEIDIDNQIESILNFKKRIRIDMGELPVVVKYNNKEEICLGLHHLHSPDPERLLIEYNVLMHAKNKTSVFS
jgi:hypothetical protein